MPQATKSKVSFLRKWLKKYDDFCKELGVDQGACRSCVPIYKADPQPDKQKDNTHHE